MHRAFILIFFITQLCGNSQNLIGNYSFEDSVGANLSGWTSTCGMSSDSGAPAGGGNWCLKIPFSETQGCVYSYAYRDIIMPPTNSGDVWELSGWLKNKPNFSNNTSYSFLKLGNMNNQTNIDKVGTADTVWTKLTLTNTIPFQTGDTAVIILYGALVGGPLSGTAYFDNISFKKKDSGNIVLSYSRVSNLEIFPNPSDGKFYLIFYNKKYTSFLVKLYAATGQMVFSDRIINFMDDYEINFSRFGKGMFTIQIIAEDEIITKKIVFQ